jgi:hypothetical protein
MNHRFLLKNFQSPGDILMLTACVRDLYRFLTVRIPEKRPQIQVQTSVPELFLYNPHISTVVPSEAECIDMHYNYSRYNFSPEGRDSCFLHFSQAFTEYLSGVIGENIPCGPMRGDLWLAPHELDIPAEFADDIFRLSPTGSYCLLNAGYKSDFRTKCWPADHYQKLVELCPDILFVQVGALRTKGRIRHFHPELEGPNLISLVGKTSIRHLVSLTAKAGAVVTPVSFLMHLAAAVSDSSIHRFIPAVVIAGGRENPRWEYYPGHTFLDTIGNRPCCTDGPCSCTGWMTEDSTKECPYPVLHGETPSPACMEDIPPQLVAYHLQQKFKRTGYRNG